MSKELQSETMDVTTALKEFENLCNWLKTFREKGFEEALVDARELAQNFDVEASLKNENKYEHKR